MQKQIQNELMWKLREEENEQSRLKALMDIDKAADEQLAESTKQKWRL